MLLISLFTERVIIKVDAAFSMIFDIASNLQKF